jgi:hypothetical protein
VAWACSSSAEPLGQLVIVSLPVSVMAVWAASVGSDHCQPWVALMVLGPGLAVAPFGGGRVITRLVAGSRAPLVTMSVKIAEPLNRVH